MLYTVYVQEHITKMCTFYNMHINIKSFVFYCIINLFFKINKRSVELQ